jgi:hypothetical protein
MRTNETVAIRTLVKKTKDYIATKEGGSGETNETDEGGREVL